jgi:hypothetical protein
MLRHWFTLRLQPLLERFKWCSTTTVIIMARRRRAHLTEFSLAEELERHTAYGMHVIHGRAPLHHFKNIVKTFLQHRITI